MKNQEKFTLSPEQLEALCRFAKANGRNWKRTLNFAWMDGSDAQEPDGCYLRQIRNQAGPEWLLKFKLPK